MIQKKTLLKIIFWRKLLFFSFFFYCLPGLSEFINQEIHYSANNSNKKVKEGVSSTKTVKWEKLNTVSIKPDKIQWEKFEGKLKISEEEAFSALEKYKNSSITSVTSYNRSIVFNNEKIGPDIGWIVPPGFKWNNKYKIDFSVRGHNTKIPDPPNRKFFGWNDGDAVGLLSYQFLHNPKWSFGANFGIRSVYQGSGYGGNTSFGEGLSAGFRWDYSLSNDSGFAIGAEQLIHFDSLTDSGRNLYFTVSKAWWNDEYEDIDFFPIYVATAGVGTGRMAVGSVRGLCSDIASDGTESIHRRLCWAPIFSLAKVWNEKFSTFFEYNSRFFLTGLSMAPFQKIPVSGTLALIISDHIDNYKVHDFSELNWVFQLRVGL